MPCGFRRSQVSSLVIAILSILPAGICHGQHKQNDQNKPEPEDNRIFWIIPNYRSSPSLHPYKPLTAKQKFMIGVKDSFDPGTVVLAGFFAGEAQLSNSTPSFGQGMAGYARYLGTAYADFTIGNFMTEATYPAMLHQDPRYFRRAKGGAWSRLGYAAAQALWTHNDSGRRQFNFSEVAGNATAVAIANAYYPDNRNAADAATKLGVQIGVDMGSNILKEFWPDINRKFFHKQ